MKLADYWDALTQHDWFYEMSDDHRVWAKGRSNQARMERISKESPEHKKLYDGFEKHVFSGQQVYGTEKAPMPERPKE